MKKLGLVSALALGMVFLAGCTSKPVTITNSDEMLDFYNKSKAMTCTLTASDEEEGNAVILAYFKDGNFYRDSKVTSLDGEVSEDYILNKNGVSYLWGDYYGENGFSSSEIVDIEEMIGELGEVEEGTTITCVNGVKNNKVFDVPTNIEFISIDDYYEDYYDDEYYDYDEEYDEYFDEEYNDENVNEENGEEEVVNEENNGEVVEENVEVNEEVAEEKVEEVIE